MRHRKPKRYRGHHRVAFAPRTRYSVVIGTALVGAGVIAFGVGTALPSPSTDVASAAAALDAENGKAPKQVSESSTDTRSADVTRASRAQTRAAAPVPEKQPLWFKPVDTGFISSGYGYRPEFHGGTDFAAPAGTPVHAASDGRIEIANWYGGYGKLVTINHGNGVVTYYGHNSKILVEPGQEVKAGETIALVGTTGQSFGNHCHFEVRINNERINPLPFLRDRGVEVG
ncbi:MAG: M23 family metallopeptidase [Corynebacteriales bacterium]|nr:M23 family metallopeptidase [Mycobacteriales bacterium]